VCARGLHIKRLQYVVNYDFPGSLEQYCHRIGRVGRQGVHGESYSLISRNMAPLVPSLIELLRSCNQVVEPNLLQLGENMVDVDDVDAEFEQTVRGDDDDNADDDKQSEGDDIEE